MDPLDGFYEAMDSESLLKEHGPSLVADAREVLAPDPSLRVAGMITTPDAPERRRLGRCARCLREAVRCRCSG